MIQPRIAIKRTCARHERGVLVIHIALLLAANAGMFAITYWLCCRQQVYSVPDILSGRDLRINWGRND